MLTSYPTIKNRLNRIGEALSFVEIERARASLRAAEKAVDAIRRRKATLQAELSKAAAEERTLEAELAEARKASEAAEAAEQENRTGRARA